jgi:plasmid stability protein
MQTPQIESTGAIEPVASITIRNLDDEVKRLLRIRAAEHGRSMEDEARDILRNAVCEPKPPTNLATAIRARIAPSDRMDIDLQKREPMPEPPQLDV